MRTYKQKKRNELVWVIISVLAVLGMIAFLFLPLL